jgi:hypothetical protein
MRAYTITSTSRPRPKAWLGVAALVLAICSLVIPSTVGAQYSSVNSITGGQSESSQPAGSQDVSAGHSSLNSITGTPSSEPTLDSSSPARTDDGFDWLSAAIGAASAMALVALGGAAYLTVRRRTAVAPSTASMS